MPPPSAGRDCFLLADVCSASCMWKKPLHRMEILCFYWSGECAGPPVPSRLQSSGVSRDDLETSFSPRLAPMPAHTCADRGHVSHVFHFLLSAALWELHEQRAKVCGNAHYRVDTRWGLVPTFLLCLKWSILAVQFSRSVMSDSLWPHGPQQARPSCPSPTPGVYSNSCPLSRWCHPTMSSSVFPKSVSTHALKNVNGVLPGTSRVQRENTSREVSVLQLWMSCFQASCVWCISSASSLHFHSWSKHGSVGSGLHSSRNSHGRT